MQKKILITKNGYEILKIIEMNSNHDKCSFKIIPMVDNNDLKITATKMFSNPEEIEFDSSKNIELTYHKKTKLYEPKIHIKMIDKITGEITYKTLPLKRIIEPNINTIIPIPLLQIIIPDNIVMKKYINDKEYKEFDIGDNNIIEIFLTNNMTSIRKFMYDLPTIANVLFNDSFELFTSGECLARNLSRTFDEIGYYGVKTVMFGSNVTKDIGIWIVNVYDKNINNNKLEVNFIENEFYLPITINRWILINNQKMKLYLRDLDNNVLLSSEARIKYLKLFESSIMKYQNYVNNIKK